MSGFSGTAEADDGGYAGRLISGDVGLGFRTTLPPAEARAVPATVVAFDPGAEPSTPGGQE